MPDGTKPQPGGWNRFMLELPDLATAVDKLRKAEAHFRNDIVTGVGGKQILLDDPSGNPVELFEPTRREAALTTETYPATRTPSRGVRPSIKASASRALALLPG